MLQLKLLIISYIYTRSICAHARTNTLKQSNPIQSYMHNLEYQNLTGILLIGMNMVNIKMKQNLKNKKK